MSTYTAMKKRREEGRAKVQMVIEAAKEPMSNKEILANPTMQGMSPHSLNHFLRGIEGIQYKNKKWSLKPKTNGHRKSNSHKKKANGADHHAPNLAHAHFLIKSNGDLFLTVGTTSLPVSLE